MQPSLDCAFRFFENTDLCPDQILIHSDDVELLAKWDFPTSAKRKKWDLIQAKVFNEKILIKGKHYFAWPLVAYGDPSPTIVYTAEALRLIVEMLGNPKELLLYALVDAALAYAKPGTVKKQLPIALVNRYAATCIQRAWRRHRTLKRCAAVKRLYDEWKKRTRENDDDDIYLVDRVLKWERGDYVADSKAYRPKAFVRWKDYGHEADSWLPLDEFYINQPELRTKKGEELAKRWKKRVLVDGRILGVKK